VTARPVVSALAVTLTTLIAMTLFEVAKESLAPRLTAWESHVATILFASCLAIVLRHLVVRRLRQAHRAVDQGEQLLQSLIDSAGDCVWRVDLEGRFLFVSPTSEGMTGYRTDELVGRHFGKVLDDEAVQVCTEHLAKRVRGDLRDESVSLELIHTRKDGSRFVGEMRTTPIFAPDGRLEAIQGTTRDITERRASEASLELSRRQFEEVLDSLDASVYVAGMETYEILFMNRYARNVWGDAVGQLCWQRLQSGQTGPCPFCANPRLLKPDGEPAGAVVWEVQNTADRRWYECRAQAIVWTDGRRARLEIATDVTERKQAEEALRDSERLLRESQAAARIGSYVVDVPSGTWTSSEALDDVFGIDRDYPRTVEGWAALVHPGSRQEVLDYYAHIQAEHAPFDKTYRVIRATDGAERWVHGLGKVEYAPSGAPIRMVGTIRDVTDVVEAEAARAKLEAKMQHAQKLESLGLLAGGIAHDFNNILMGVLGNASLALAQLSPESPARPCVEQVETAALRAADLAKQMLAYSGKGRFVVERLDLAKLVDEMSHLLESSITKKAVLRRRLDPGVAMVEGDATQLRQIVMNLITNASDAVGDEPGVITISAALVQADRSYFAGAYIDDNLPEGQYVALEVADTGCGMDEQTKARMFDPFFSTKRTGRGLGMAAVLGIVRGHRGAIKVYSEPGRGTSVKVVLPYAEGEDPPPGDGQDHGDASAMSQPITGTILVADDEEPIRQVTRMALEMAGFSVVVARDGREAVEVFGQHADDVILVLLDMSMPRMSGEEAFMAIKRMRRDVPVLLSSGFNEQDSTSRLVGRGIAGFIQKPYRPNELVARVRQLVGR